MQSRSFAAFLPVLAGLAQTFGQAAVTPPFASQYTLVDLGVPSGLPAPAGALTIKADDTNTLIVAGSANSLWVVRVQRDPSGHITGFQGPATRMCDAQSIDGGLGYGPNNVLFYGRYPGTTIGQIRLGSSTTNKVADVGAIGVTASTSSINFVPAGFPGAGRCKVLTYPSGQWWDLTLVPDGAGTYNIPVAAREAGLLIPGNPEGFAYVPQNSALFAGPSILVTEWAGPGISAYSLDATGTPLVASRKQLISGTSSIEGANFDPVSGDFLFTTYGLAHIYAIHGFTPGTVSNPCYPNCDSSTVAPLLNANDFQCFLNAFASGDTYANCDNSSVAPVLNANDFQCFLNTFANGCS